MGKEPQSSKLLFELARIKTRLAIITSRFILSTPEQKQSLVLCFSVIALACFFSFFPNFDADFGWHLKTGEYIWQTKSVPHTDIFSFSLPDHPYIAHSWLTDLLLYVVYYAAGHNGVVIFYGVLLGTSILALSLSASKPWHRIVIPAVIPFVLISVGLRTQVVSFFWLSVLLGLLIHHALNKFRILIPLIFLLWANMHAGFTLGLGVLGIFVLYQAIKSQNKHRTIKFAGLWVVSWFATLINPYFYLLHLQVFRMLTNSTAVIHNLDWLPYLENPIFSDSHKLILGSWLLAGLAASKNNKFALILLVIFSLASLQSTRFLMPLLVILISHTPAILESLTNRIAANKRLVLCLLIVLMMAYRQVPQVEQTLLIHSNEETYALASINQGNYPYQAVKILKQQSRPLRIFNYYDWGGYLIWQLPQHKTFIDGRMDNFFVENQSFMQEYLNILEGKKPLETYDIDAILVPQNSPLLKKIDENKWQNIQTNDSSRLFIKKDLR